MGYLKRITFWLSIFSIMICLNDIRETIYAPDILDIGLGPFEPFKHWMFDFDPFKPPSSALITAKFPGYIVHFAFFLFVGAILDKGIRLFKRKDGVKA